MKKHSYRGAGLFVLVFALLALVQPITVQAADQRGTLEFGIVPQQSAVKLLKAWGPLIKYLSTKTGRPIRFATAPTIGEFEKRCAAGEYDIAYMNPYHYVRFSKDPGYRVLAHQSHKQLTGIFVVRKDSDLSSLTDLEGATLHFPSPNAFAATLLTQAMLKRNGIRFTPHYAGSHDSVYLNVARGLAESGGGVVRTFQVQPDVLRAQLRILAKTKGYTPHAFAVHPRVDKKLAASITRALLGLPPELRKNLKFKPLKAAVDADYDDVRALGIENPLGR